MKPRVSDEIKAELLARVYTDLMPDQPPPKPKPKLEAEVLPFPPILSEQELATARDTSTKVGKANTRCATRARGRSAGALPSWTGRP